MADGQTVRRRSIEQMIGGDELPGARHVLHDNTRTTRKMFAEMARHHATIGIESAAGSGADNHHDGFPVEELLGRGRNGGAQE